MWTNKEVILISLATGLAFCFATIYTQNKFHQYVENKVTEKSTNPLASLLSNETRGLGQMRLPDMPVTQTPPQQSLRQEPHVHVPEPEPQKKFHDCPPGSGERWTPLEIR